MSSQATEPCLERREVLREMLSRCRDELYQRVAEFRREQEQEAEPPPADSMEAARATAEVETHASLIGRSEDELKCLDEALERVEHGAYGVCAECGEEIPIERLTAIPFALYCVGCQDKRNHARRPWSEGAMIAPYDSVWTLPEEMRQPREYRVATNIVESAPPRGEARRPLAAQAARKGREKPGGKEKKRPRRRR